VILHHATAFGSAEPEAGQSAVFPPAPPAGRGHRSIARAAAARQRIEAWLARAGGGLVLTRPAAVAWACGGVAPPVDRTAGTDLVWAVFTAGEAWLITTNVEAPRILAEYDPAAHGFAGLAEVPWYSPGDFVSAAAEVAGLESVSLASDGNAAFGADAFDDLVALRLALSDAERDDLAELGADAARSLQDGLAQWQPGERDLDIQARCAGYLEAAGADAPVLIVGGDDRLERYRHPMATGAPVRRIVMAVAVARRAGLHVALTRFAAAGPVEPGYAALRRKVLAIDDAVLASSIQGATYGTVLESLARAYAANGAEGGWMGHYQGGPIGFAQREFEIAPGQTGSRWYRERVAAGHAIAWNPSLPGGAKSEDTYLLAADGSLGLITGAAGWPSEISEGGNSHPAVLEVER
jgi:Xaa-Pro dipeptidase